MKKTKIKSDLPAFSLAEALITLLIVALISLASVPVITKKKRINSGHGKWMCTLNGSGQHIFWTNGSQGTPNNPNSWAATGTNYCKFTPPGSARNFAITAVGGGGGGGGADGSDAQWLNTDAAINSPGMYYMVAIGGGGGGGGSSDKDDQARCGGMGGIAAVAAYLDENVKQLKITKGSGGSHGTGSNDGHAGNASGSTITVLKSNNNTGNTESCQIINAPGGMGGYNGQHGKDHAERGGQAGKATVSTCGLSNFSYKAYTPNTETEPMRGKYLKKKSSDYDKITGIGHPTKTMQSEINKILKIKKIYPEIEMDSSNKFKNNISYYSLSSADRKIRDDFCAIHGLGGAAKQGKDACSSHSGNNGSAGKDGYVGIYTKIYKSGEGGKSGEIVKNAFYPSLEKALVVTIGAGGQGGNRGAGSQGGTTIITNTTIQPLVGGAGGRLKSSDNKAYTKTPGENGEKTKLYYSVEPAIGYGGLTDYNNSADGMTGAGFGSGGGGGGISPETEANPGVGANGAPGIVIIEW